MPVKTTKDGRTIKTGRDYTQFRREVYEAQCFACVRCGRFCNIDAPWWYDNSFHVHHVDGRGMGGSLRDDVIGNVEGLCGRCHRIEHGQ